MKKSHLLFLFIFTAKVLHAGNADEIENLIRSNIAATQSESIAGVMDTMHPDSVSYAQTKQLLPGLFEQYNLKYTLISYKYIAEDGEYAYARVLQRTEKVSGPEFRSNDLDMIQIFKRDQGLWKLWSQAVLEVSPVNR